LQLTPRLPVGKVQTRLRSAVVDELVRTYQDGSSVRQLAATFSISRTTVLAHLEKRGVPRRVQHRKLTDEDVRAAADLYGHGLSLTAVGQQFRVDAQTVRKEFSRAGVVTRPRRGWKQTQSGQPTTDSVILPPPS
jgi:hypothetical protein